MGYIPTMFVDKEAIAQKNQQTAAKNKEDIKEKVQQELQGSKAVAQPAAVEKPVASKIADNWKYEIDEDKMRGTKKLYATLKSTSILQLGFPYNDSQMVITVRKMEKETNVLISVKGQIVCNQYSEKCYVNVKSNDDAIVKYDYTETAHGRSDTIFIAKEKEFITMLKKSNKLIIEVPMYDKGRVQYEFDAAGLKWEE